MYIYSIYILDIPCYSNYTLNAHNSVIFAKKNLFPIPQNLVANVANANGEVMVVTVVVAIAVTSTDMQTDRRTGRQPLANRLHRQRTGAYTFSKYHRRT